MVRVKSFGGQRPNISNHSRAWTALLFMLSPHLGPGRGEEKKKDQFFLGVQRCLSGGGIVKQFRTDRAQPLDSSHGGRWNFFPLIRQCH